MSFYKVRCKKCKNQQIIFEKVSSEIKCLVCDKEMASPTGGKSTIHAQVLEVIN